jgi:hypothetical protein
MPPTWDPKESEDDEIYEPVKRHSPGMISFTYQPNASEEVLEALKDTATFKSLSSSDNNIRALAGLAASAGKVRSSSTAKEPAKLTAE